MPQFRPCQHFAFDNGTFLSRKNTNLLFIIYFQHVIKTYPNGSFLSHGTFLSHKTALIFRGIHTCMVDPSNSHGELGLLFSFFWKKKSVSDS